MKLNSKPEAQFEATHRHSKALSVVISTDTYCASAMVSPAATKQDHSDAAQQLSKVVFADN